MIRKETFPDFSKPSLWYDLYVTPKGHDPKVASEYPDVYFPLKDAQKALGILTKTKTQGGRKHSSSLALAKGAQASMVDLAGHWNTTSRSGAYTSKVIPWDVVRILSGSNKNEGCYYVTRNAVKPPETLKVKIFPSLQLAKEQLTDSIRNGRNSEIAGESFFNATG